MKLMTWNMQGAGTSVVPGVKWQVLADYLIGLPDEERPSVIAVQECGEVPGKISGAWQSVDSGFIPNGWLVDLFRWKATSTASGASRTYYVSWILWDIRGNRVHLAVISESKPADATGTFAGEGCELRPALGVKIDHQWYFSVHANAAYGCDAEELLANIWTAVSCGPWIALGDYNTPPERIAWNGVTLSQPTERCKLNPISTSRADYTHPRDGLSEPKLVLDYAVQTKGFAMTSAERVDLGLSDHYAVTFSS